VLRSIEEEGTRRRSAEICLYVPTNVALYILNQKRESLNQIEARYGIKVMVARDDSLIPPAFRVERLRPYGAGEAPPLRAIQAPTLTEAEAEADEDEDEDIDDAAELMALPAEVTSSFAGVGNPHSIAAIAGDVGRVRDTGDGLRCSVETRRAARAVGRRDHHAHALADEAFVRWDRKLVIGLTGDVRPCTGHGIEGVGASAGHEHLPLVGSRSDGAVGVGCAGEGGSQRAAFLRLTGDLKRPRRFVVDGVDGECDGRGIAGLRFIAGCESEAVSAVVIGARRIAPRTVGVESEGAVRRAGRNRVREIDAVRINRGNLAVDDRVLITTR